MASPAIPLPQQSKTSRKIRSNLIGYLLIMPPILLMGLLIFYPALQSLVRTLVIQNDNGSASLSLERYVGFFRDPLSVSNLVFTVVITLVTVALLFVVCFPLAVYLRFSRS